MGELSGHDVARRVSDVDHTAGAWHFLGLGVPGPRRRVAQRRDCRGVSQLQAASPFADLGGEPVNRLSRREDCPRRRARQAPAVLPRRHGFLARFAASKVADLNASPPRGDFDRCSIELELDIAGGLGERRPDQRHGVVPGDRLQLGSHAR